MISGDTFWKKILSVNIQNLTEGSFILLIGQILSIGLSAFGIILVARFLSATNFGIVSVALIPLEFASLFLDWG